MFTGLIRECAKVISYKENHLELKAVYKPKIGDSICVNGACLSVINLKKDTFKVELSAETRKNIATENLKDMVHIEPAMLLGERLDGHMVQGHIDAIGTIVKIKHDENGVDFFLDIPNEILHFVSQKGSICVDGVSLTVNEVKENICRLTIIPITFKETLFNTYSVGRRVNIESDLIARYIFSMLSKVKNKSLTWDYVDSVMSVY